MALLWGTHYLKNTLPEELLDRFDSIKSDPHDKPGPDRKGFLPLYNGKTGDLVAKIPGGEAVRVNREKLRKFLSDDLDIQVCPDELITSSKADVHISSAKCVLRSRRLATTKSKSHLRTAPPPQQIQSSAPMASKVSVDALYSAKKRQP